LPDIDADGWFWLLTLAVGVVAGGTAALRWLRVARLIEDTPTSRVRSAAQGYVELSGRGEPLPGAQNLAPLTRRPCIWWRYRISKRETSGKSQRQTWHTVASGTSSIPFVLDDGSGQCIVKPDGAEIVPTEATTWYGDAPWPTAAPGAGGISFAERGYRYVEERIYQHELVYALGEFRSTTTSAEQEMQSAQSALLADWKQDQPALIQRFDADRDGRISLTEWESAREAARRTVAERATVEPAHEVRHVLCRPDEGQLFLLAALPPGDVARRYRRRAMWAFVAFLAGVYALGWLLQHGLG
jgi:hypothetical protein